MFDALIAPVVALVAWAQQALHESVVQPVLFAAGWMAYDEFAYDGLEWVVIGALEIAVLLAVMPWVERRWPAEPVVDRAAVRTDVVYTLLHRLGAIPMLAFLLIQPAADTLEAWLRSGLGVSRPNLDQIWPGVTDLPLVSFVIYLVVLDFVDYWMHRGQHAWRWWWTLHAVHHSQRQMTFWSDQRNHLLDDLLRDAILAAVALAIGVAPGQFLALVVASRLVQNLQHANVRWRWGGPAESILVSPSFHRRHHAIGAGHEGPAGGCNFAVLFPVWDRLFGTADFAPGFVPTGIRDQLEGRDYGRGFWSQQWRALRRLAGADRWGR